MPSSKRGAHVAREATHGQDDQWNGDHGKECELPAHGEEHRRHAHKKKNVDQNVRYGVGHKVLEQVGVVHRAGHELPRLLVLVEAKREPLQMTVDLIPNVGYDVPSGHVGRIATDKAHDRPEHVDQEREQRQARYRGECLRSRLRVGDRVHHGTHEPRGQELDAHEADHAHHREHERQSVALDVAQDCLKRPHDWAPPIKPGRHVASTGARRWLCCVTRVRPNTTSILPNCSGVATVWDGVIAD